MGELRVSLALPLVDTYGRVHRDLRVSLTDRCNLRCTYCMPADFADWIPSPELLTTDELMTVLDVATRLGITGVRLTGGLDLDGVVSAPRRAALGRGAPPRGQRGSGAARRCRAFRD